MSNDPREIVRYDGEIEAALQQDDPSRRLMKLYRTADRREVFVVALIARVVMDASRRLLGGD